SSTPAVALPTAVERFTDTLPLGGSRVYTFNVAQNGTVKVTLLSLAGSNVSPTATVSLGFGSPSDAGCTTTSTVNAQAGTVPQISGTYGSGAYCVVIGDV